MKLHPCGAVFSIEEGPAKSEIPCTGLVFRRAKTKLICLFAGRSQAISFFVFQNLLNKPLYWEFAFLWVFHKSAFLLVHHLNNSINLSEFMNFKRVIIPN